MPNIIEITDFHAPELDPYAPCGCHSGRQQDRKSVV